MAWKQRGEHARSSDESTQTVLGPVGSGPTELLCVPQVGGGAGGTLFGIPQDLSGDQDTGMS